MSTKEDAQMLLPAKNEHLVDNPCHLASEDGATGSHLRPCIMTKAASLQQVPLIALPCLPCMKGVSSSAVSHDGPFSAGASKALSARKTAISFPSAECIDGPFFGASPTASSTFFSAPMTLSIPGAESVDGPIFPKKRPRQAPFQGANGPFIPQR
jgi:hypothetical protein